MSLRPAVARFLPPLFPADRTPPMLSEYLTAAFVTLLVTVDPPGLAPIFLGITPGMSDEARRQVATRAVLIAGGIMAASGIAGAQLLGALGISLPAFRIAGGLLLFWIAFEMVFARRNERKTVHAEQAVTLDHIRNVAAFPLAIPLMAGPARSPRRSCSPAGPRATC